MTRGHVLIIGGSSGMGLALAEHLLADGDTVTIAGRSADRLAKAAATLGHPDRLRTEQLDIIDEDRLRALFAGIGRLNHVVVTAADANEAYLPLAEFGLTQARRVLDTKLLGPWLVAKHAAPVLAEGGSITFTSGIASHRPMARASVYASANGALDALARALAVELAPIRVNTVSPGWVDTPIWDTLAGPAKPERLAAMAAKLPAGRIGRPDDIARAFVSVLDNGFITGAELAVDGGHRLV